MNCRFVILLCIILDYGVSFAQKPKKDSTFRLKEVEVFGTKILNKDKSIMPMQTLTKVEITKLSGNTVADAVKTFSGVTLKDYGGIGGLKTVMVRSLGANHTGVFMDGVPFSDMATGQIDLGKVSTENSDDVSLIIGQSSSICLPARYYASASIISIQSEKPAFINKNINVKAGIKTGSFGLFNPVLTIQNRWNKTTYSDFSFDYTSAAGDYPVKIDYGNNHDSTQKRKNSDIESLNINGSVVSVLCDSSKLSLKLYYYNSERGLPGAVIYYNPFASQRLWNSDFFANLQFRSNNKKHWEWLTNLKFSRNWLRYLDPDYLNTSGKLYNHYLQQEYYFSQAVAWKPIDSLRLSLASDFFINKLDANLDDFVTPTRYSFLNVFALQYSRSRIECNGNLLATLVHDETEKGKSAPSQSVLSPSFSAGYKLMDFPSLRIRFLYKDIFRMPTFNDLYYTLVGNNKLNPEYAREYNLGLTAYCNFGFIDYVSLKADAFYNYVKDKIVAVPTKNLFVWSMRNIGKVDIRGAELQCDIKTRPLWNISYTLSCNYTYQKATDITDKNSSTYNQQIPYIPYETFSARASATYRSFSLSYNALYNGYRYVLGENIYENMLSSWWTGDVSLLCEIKRALYSVRLKGEISNLFNKQYEVIRSFPMPGRAYAFAITVVY